MYELEFEYLNAREPQAEVQISFIKSRVNEESRRFLRNAFDNETDFSETRASCRMHVTEAQH